MKTCSRCKQEKEITEFYKNKATPDGKNKYCKSCSRKYNKMNEQREETKLRRSLPSRRKQCVASAKKWNKNNKEKLSIYNKVYYAVKNNNLARLPCEICGELKVEAHHDDYAKPLDIRWFCRKHHMERHEKLRTLLT